MKLLILLSLATLTISLKEHKINKRVLPTNENCDPDSQVCRKGDWIAKHIADCKYDGFLTCDAQNDVLHSWTVDVAQGDRCKPVDGKRFTCGATGTNTRCVCSDTNIFYNPGFNTCRCQYWPPEDIGENSPAFCTGYYVGGTFSVHHYACCNNCNDPPPNTCDAVTWQGGSTGKHCSSCGQNKGGGRVKYYFNCGSCDQQYTCKKRCGTTIPGLCWKWLDCFEGCCLKSATQPQNKRDVSELLFCGDGICSGTESPQSCPADCCYQINSDNCTQGLDNCSPECCHAPHCCLDSEPHGSNKAISIGIGVSVGIVVPAIAIVIIIATAVACHMHKRRKDYDRVGE